MYLPCNYVLFFTRVLCVPILCFLTFFSIYWVYFTIPFRSISFLFISFSTVILVVALEITICKLNLLESMSTLYIYHFLDLEYSLHLLSSSLLYYCFHVFYFHVYFKHKTFLFLFSSDKVDIDLPTQLSCPVLFGPYLLYSVSFQNYFPSIWRSLFSILFAWFSQQLIIWVCLSEYFFYYAFTLKDVVLEYTILGGQSFTYFIYLCVTL